MIVDRHKQAFSITCEGFCVHIGKHTFGLTAISLCCTCFDKVLWLLNLNYNRIWYKTHRSYCPYSICVNVLDWIECEIWAKLLSVSLALYSQGVLMTDSRSKKRFITNCLLSGCLCSLGLVFFNKGWFTPELLWYDVYCPLWYIIYHHVLSGLFSNQKFPNPIKYYLSLELVEQAALHLLFGLDGFKLYLRSAGLKPLLWWPGWAGLAALYWPACYSLSSMLCICSSV